MVDNNSENKNDIEVIENIYEAVAWLILFAFLSQFVAIILICKQNLLTIKKKCLEYVDSLKADDRI